MSTEPIGKFMMILGGFIFLLGILIFFKDALGLNSILKLFGNLPGDIKYKSGNSSFYFPLTTCLVISIIFSLISYIIRKFL